MRSSRFNESQEGAQTNTSSQPVCTHELNQIGHQWVKDGDEWVQQWRDVCACGRTVGPWEDL